MEFTFKKANKEKSKLRMALIGISGSGKTYSSLSIAQELGQKIAVIDTEKGSASKYADVFNFDVLELDHHSPETYSQAIKAAGRAGYDVIVIDSLSHAWIGNEGALKQVDDASKRSSSGNSFFAWRDVTPKHNAMIDAILSSPAHIIATMRAKTEYTHDKDSRGKIVPRKVGLAPVQRDGLEYEFDIVGDMTQDNDLIITKTRCSEFRNSVISTPGKEFGEKINAWLTTGIEKPVIYDPNNEPSTEDQLEEIQDICLSSNNPDATIQWIKSNYNVSLLEYLSCAQADELLIKLKSKLNK